MAKTLCATGHLTFVKFAGCWWTGASRQQDISISKQGDRLQAMSKFVCTIKISKLIHFQSKNSMTWRYVLTVVTSHILINNEMHDWLNHVFVSLLSLLTEPADESETDGHLTGMGPRLIMNICPIFYGPAFLLCQLAYSESWFHSHTCTWLSYLFWNQFSPDLPWRRIPGNKWIDGLEYVRKTVLRVGDTWGYCNSNVRIGTYSCHSRH